MNVYEIHGVRFVTATEAAQMLGPDVRKTTIDAWVRRGLLIPVCKFETANIFRWRDVVDVEYRVRSSGKSRRRAAPRVVGLTGSTREDTMSKIPQADHAAQNQGKRIGSSLPPLDKPVVYYVRFSDRVKIGYSLDFARRILCLPHDEVLAVEPGGRELEVKRHAQFAADRIKPRGEWFHMSPALRSHIRKVIREHGTAADVMATPPEIPPSHAHLRVRRNNWS